MKILKEGQVIGIDCEIVYDYEYSEEMEEDVMVDGEVTVYDTIEPGEFLIKTDSARELMLVESVIEYLESPKCDYDKFGEFLDAELGNIQRIENGK